MEITIKGRIAFKLKDVLSKLNVEVFQDIKNEYHDVCVDMHTLTENEIARLIEICEKSGVPGTKVIAADAKKYLKAGRDGIDSVTARTVRQAAWMMEHYVAGLKHHVIFSEDEYEGGSFVGYYVDDVDYIPENKRDREREHVQLHLVWVEDDERQATHVEIYEEDVIGHNAEEILRAVDYVPESPTLMERLKGETERFYEIRDRVGKKFEARGLAATDIDNALSASNHWYRDRDKIRLDHFGLAAQVVIDILQESEKEGSRSRRGVGVNLYRWHSWNMRFFSPSEDSLVRHLEADEKTDFAPHLQLPVHPLVPCFDLKRHARLRAHVNNLTEYKFRREVAEGLVIPETDRDLIDLLVDQSSNVFQDVVEGKGRSMNILSGGPAGTGKTLTAEVFAEFKERPLYNVQCSQLGLDPETIEKNLAVVLQRANRWNAVLLLDEADVYIRERGDDLTHNAIVGVFLRMLEYANCILFMTTNMPEIVDDAIASRCIVALRYDVPSTEAQFKIWRNLAELNNLPIMDATIREFTRRHPRVSGRDVKNLLKLASFTSKSERIGIDALEFALKYKPTADVVAD